MVNRCSDRLVETGITWRSRELDFSRLPWHPRRIDAIESMMRHIPRFVGDAAALEGNPATELQVTSIIDGTSPIPALSDFDRLQILALRDAHLLVLGSVRDGSFTLDKATSDMVHAVVARHEAIESGHFRGEGHVGGGGTVDLGEGRTHHALAPGEGGSALLGRYDALIGHLQLLDDPRERALAYFAAATRAQFYFDGNKRTARLLMNGALMISGYEAVTVPKGRANEFNTHLSRLFDSHEASGLMNFLSSCQALSGE